MAAAIEIQDNGSNRWIWFNRAAERNSLEPRMIAELTSALSDSGEDPNVRNVVLAGRGPAFSAGADLRWMQAAANYDRTRNLDDARALADLMRTISTLPKPVIARVHGPAVGGGVGIVAASDIALASTKAWFQLSEVRLGLIPAVISPYLVAALGPRQARRWMLGAERFSAEHAVRLGLVTEVCHEDGLDARIAEFLDSLLSGGPEALASAKNLVSSVAGRAIDAALLDETARRIADVRAGTEGQEGIAAFLEKRSPKWRE